jgi:uncharacterized protein with PQ loop repeat
MAILLITFFIPCLLAYLKKYHMAKISFAIFVIVFIADFIYHISDKLNIQL